MAQNERCNLCFNFNIILDSVEKELLTQKQATSFGKLILAKEKSSPMFCN